MPVIDAVRPSGLSVRVQALLPRVTYRLAVDENDRDEIFRLRHDAYLREGAIEAKADSRFHDAVDEQENAFLFGVHIDDELAGSIRLNVTLPHERALPTTAVFPEFVGPKVGVGDVIIDPTRFAARPALAGRFPELPYLTLRLAWLAAEHFDGDWILLAVRREHRAFYRRYWSAIEVCEPRPYPRLSKPVGLSVVDYRAVRDHVTERYPFLRSTIAERAALFPTDISSLPEQELPSSLWQVEPKQPGLSLSL